MSKELDAHFRWYAPYMNYTELHTKYTKYYNYFTLNYCTTIDTYHVS